MYKYAAMSLWRYNFSTKNVDKGKRFLKGINKTEPSYLKGRKGEIKKGKLYIDGLQVVPTENVEDYIRKKVLGGRVPMSRDALYYFLSKNAIGVTRAAIDKLLKAQHIIRETDNLQPSTKKKPSRRVLKKGQIEFDLVEINWIDLGFKPTDDEVTRDAGYIFTVADSLTGLIYAKFSPTKNQKDITPRAKEGFNWMAEKLKTPLSKMHSLSDSGDEFNFKLYNKWGLRTKQVARGPLIEVKNSQLQRALYRIAKMKKTKSINTLVKNAMDVVNRTQSSLTKKAPIEAIDEKQSDLAEKYNKRRGKGSGVKVKLKPLKPGEMVRLMLLKDKEKKNYTFHKAYKGKSWSRKRYAVLSKRGNRYKIDGPKGKKFYHRDDLKLTTPVDKKTIKILHDRERATEKAEKAERAKIRKDIDEQAKKSKRPKRKAAQKAKDKYRAMMDKSRELDKRIGS